MLETDKRQSNDEGKFYDETSNANSKIIQHGAHLKATEYGNNLCYSLEAALEDGLILSCCILFISITKVS